MEWADFDYSSFDESLFGFLSPQIETEQKPEWTLEENKLFENALAEINPASPTFFENVGSRVPWKSMDEIKLHYQALVEDIQSIESGKFPVPDYHQTSSSNVIVGHIQRKQPEEVVTNVMQDQAKKDEGSPSNESKSTKSGQQRRRGVPWTEEEHQLFLMGLNKYGKGDWRSISRYYVITKTPTQVASHAQKYFRRQTSSTPMDRRRPSIHDIQTVTSTTFTSVSSQIRPQPITPAFSSSSCSTVLPITIPEASVHDQNPIYINTTFPSDDDQIFSLTAAAAAYPSPPYMLPSIMDQQWG